MNIQRLVLLAIIISFTACKKDSTVPEISIAEQNIQDDGAIETFLNTYYFGDLGEVVAFSDTDTSDDLKTPLMKMAVKLPDGVWYVKNPNSHPTGIAVTNENTQKILLNYDFKVFSSGVKNAVYTVNDFYTIIQTINSTGLPTWDVPFYRIDLSSTSTYKEDYYEMEGFKEAIKYFDAVNKDVEVPYVFEGVIIVPSRLNYARDTNFYNLRNQVAVISFEIYKIAND